MTPPAKARQIEITCPCSHAAVAPPNGPKQAVADLLRELLQKLQCIGDSSSECGACVTRSARRPLKIGIVT